MANWEGFQQSLKGLGSSFIDIARQKQAKEQIVSDMIQKLIMEAKIKQMFPDATSELTQTKNFLEIQKLAREMNLGGTPTSGLPQGAGIEGAGLPSTKIVEPSEITPTSETDKLGTSGFTDLYEEAKKPVPYISKGFNIFGASLGSEPDPIEQNWRKEIVKNRKTAMQNFNETAGLLQTTVSVWKAADQELKAKNVPEGLASRLTENIANAFELQGFPNVKAYAGQVIETAMSLSKIVTGGSRIIRSVINQLIKTLPTLSGIEGDMRAKVGQTFKNSFGRALGRPLTKEEMGKVNEQLSGILDVSPMSNAIGGIGKFNAPSAPTEKIFQVSGENYRVPIDKVLDFINSKEFEGKEIFDVTGQVR